MGIRVRLGWSVLACAGSLLLSASSAWAETECVDHKAEKEELVRLVPPTPADMCLLDSSQCSPSDPIPTPVEVSPPSQPQLLAVRVPALLLRGRGVPTARPQDDPEEPGFVRELLRPPQ